MANKVKHKKGSFGLRLGPAGKGKCLCSSVVGDIKYNRRKENAKWKKELTSACF